MATLIPPSLNENQRSRLLAQIKLKDTFDDKALSLLSSFSSDIIPHLTDHFILVNDLRTGLMEEVRRIYFDYSFVVFPIHKSFERFLQGVLEVVFSFKVSKDKPIGMYLNYSLAQKNKILDEMLKLPWGKKITKEKWIERWDALCQQWKNNRNPLTHPEQERILNLTKAEQVAGAIIREMEISLKLFWQEFLAFLVEYVEKEEKAKMKQTEELAQEKPY
jgi:hypothetical protein